MAATSLSAVGRQVRCLAGLALVFIVATAVFLSQWKRFQRLGAPGVKLAEQRIYFEPTRAGDIPLEARLAGTNVVALPTSIPGFESKDLPLAQAVFEILPKDTTFGQKRYIASDGSYFADNLVVLMGSDRTSIHQPQYCLVGMGFRIESQTETFVRINRPHEYDLPVMKIIARRQHPAADGRTIEISGVFLYWFVSEDRVLARHHERMISMAKSLVTKRILERWAYITYFAPCLPGHEEETFERLSDLIRAGLPEYQTATLPPSHSVESRLN